MAPVLLNGAERMKEKTKRAVVEVVIASVGLVLGLAAAAAFNLAGLTWSTSGFSTAYYWDPSESTITAAAGCLFLLVWLVSLIVIGAMSTASYRRNARVDRVGIVVASLSFVLVCGALIFALVVLPAQYSWVSY